MVAIAYAVAASAWVIVATLSPTVEAALIAAAASVVASVTSLVNAWLLARHERHVDERFDERRVVIVQADDGVLVSDEDRRQLEDRRAMDECRKKRERRHRSRRDEPL